MAELLSVDQVQELLSQRRGWGLSGESIERLFKFRGFPEAIDFVDRVAQVSEKLNHHPDIDIRWNKVKLVLSTHSAGGLTALDFEAATQFDGLTEGKEG